MPLSRHRISFLIPTAIPFMQFLQHLVFKLLTYTDNTEGRLFCVNHLRLLTYHSVFVLLPCTIILLFALIVTRKMRQINYSTED